MGVDKTISRSDRYSFNTRVDRVNHEEISKLWMLYQS